MGHAPGPNSVSIASHWEAQHGGPAQPPPRGNTPASMELYHRPLPRHHLHHTPHHQQHTSSTSNSSTSSSIPSSSLNFYTLMQSISAGRWRETDHWRPHLHCVPHPGGPDNTEGGGGTVLCTVSQNNLPFHHTKPGRTVFLNPENPNM